MPIAIGRSKPEPSFFRSAGARLIVIRVGGISNPEFLIADRTRSRLSRTAASGSPTVLKISFSSHHAGVVDLHIDDIGIDPVHRCT